MTAALALPLAIGTMPVIVAAALALLLLLLKR